MSQLKGKQRRITFVWENQRITSVKKAPCPGFPMPLMFAGSNYFVFKKEAIDFILTDPVVKRFLEWSKDTLTPGSIMIA